MLGLGDNELAAIKANLARYGSLDRRDRWQGVQQRLSETH